MSPLRIWLVGFGVVGQWLARALDAQTGQLAARYGRQLTVAGIGNARDGFIYHPDGLDLASTLADAGAGRPITQQPGVRVWPSAIDGLRATEADLLVEVTASPRNRPALTLPAVVATGENDIGICPPSKSVSAGPVPL